MGKETLLLEAGRRPWVSGKGKERDGAAAVQPPLGPNGGDTLRWK